MNVYNLIHFETLFCSFLKKGKPVSKNRLTFHKTRARLCLKNIGSIHPYCLMLGETHGDLSHTVGQKRAVQLRAKRTGAEKIELPERTFLAKI